MNLYQHKTYYFQGPPLTATIVATRSQKRPQRQLKPATATCGRQSTLVVGGCYFFLTRTQYHNELRRRFDCAASNKKTSSQKTKPQILDTSNFNKCTQDKYNEHFDKLLNYPKKFFKYFCLSIGTFWLLALLYDGLLNHDNNMRKSIALAERLAITLR